jgi:hypothetical protein
VHGWCAIALMPWVGIAQIDAWHLSGTRARRLQGCSARALIQLELQHT